jgi:transposase
VHIAVDVRTKQIIAMEITKEEVSDGCMPRRVAVVEQLGNAGWIRAKGYGYRWMAESAFSSIKRVFGEHISSIKWGNIVKELLLKASIYNLFMAMNP